MKNNTISIIKLLCPVIVIFTHTVALTGKTEIITIINSYIGSYFIPLGIFAVSTIFLISGYLFNISISKNRNDRLFWYRKITRLITPLAIVVVASIFLGAFISSYTVCEYLLSKNTYKYLLNILFIPRYNLPGVFVNNPYADVVNGSLWTMPLTILCYLSCFIANRIEFINKKIISITVLMLICLLLSVYFKNAFFKSTFYPVTSFYIGVCFNRYKNKIIYNTKLFLLCILITIMSIIFNVTLYSYFIIYPYLLFFIVYKININVEIFKRDFSYEMYLCAFPIQQSLVYFSNNSMNQMTHFVAAIILSIVVGVIIRESSILITKRINGNESLCYRS